MYRIRVARGIAAAFAGLLGLFSGAGPAAAQVPNTEAPPFVPTPAQIVDLMLRMADVGEGDVVYDLGAGDGRLVIAAAERGARGVGIEYQEDLVRRARASADSAGVASRVRFHRKDLFETEIMDASVVTLYLSADFNLRLRPRLLRELRPGSRVVSHAFHMGDWVPDDAATIGTGAARATIFLWIVPADVDGFWNIEVDGAPPMGLELRQRYQTLTGEAWSGGVRYIVQNGRVRGEEVEFQLERRGAGRRVDGAVLSFRGRVDGDRIVGLLRGPSDREQRAVNLLRFSDPAMRPTASFDHDLPATPAS